MKILKTAVVGVGNMGFLHAKIYSEFSGSDLVAVSDSNEKALKKASDFFDVKTYSNYEEMFAKEDLDCVSICTPDREHLGPALKATEFGVNILIEKPLAKNGEEGQLIVDAAQRAGLKLMVGHTLHFDPAHVQAYQAIRDKKIGDIVHIYTRRNCLISEGKQLVNRTSIILFLGIHDLDVIRWLTGSEIERVYCEANSVVFKKEKEQDVFLALIRFRNGVTASLETSWILPESLGRTDMKLSVVGSKGYINIDTYDMGFRLYGEDKLTMGDTRWAPVVYGSLRGVLQHEVSDFVNCVIEGRDPVITGKDGLAALQAVDAIIESSKTHQPVYL